MAAEMECNHAGVGELEYSDGDLALAICAGTEFWIVGRCLKCGRLVDIEILRGEIQLILTDEVAS